MAQSLKHKRSSVVTNGAPKLPTTDQIAVGEIAINFAEGYETLSTRNNNDGIATFSSDSVLDKKYISSGAVVSAMTKLSGILEDDEYTIAQALNEQNDRIIAIEESYEPCLPLTSGGTVTGFTNGYIDRMTKESFSSATTITIDGINIKLTENSERKGVAASAAKDYEITTYEKDGVSIEHGGITAGGGVFSNTRKLVYPTGYEGNRTIATVEDLPTEESLLNSGFTKNALTAYTETDPTVPAWAKATNKPTYTASEVGALPTGATLDSVADGTTRKLSDYSLTGHTHSEYSLTGHSHTAAEVGALSTATTYFDDVEYDSNSKRINFKKNSTVIDYVDATDFIKDGMVSSVTVSNGNLVLTFNTDAGKEDITLALTQIFNPNNYYDKTAADGRFLTGYTETDPTVPAWAKESTKPSYTAAEVGAMATSERSNYLPTGTTLDGIADGTTRKLSNYSLTGHSHTAAEVGAMATSERNNYLPTGTTLDNIADGTTRKLSNYSLTGHTHDNYSLTSHTHSQYASTAHTHTAAEIGALPTGTTLDNIADGSTRKLSNYSLTSHTHTAAEVGALPNTTDIPTQASIASSGFTKNTGTLTGVTINGSAATVSNGNASFTIELGGGSGSGLPAVTAADNGKILQVVDGQWQLVTPTVVYTGSDAPSNTLGNNGDIYLQTS